MFINQAPNKQRQFTACNLAVTAPQRLCAIFNQYTAQYIVGCEASAPTRT
jgi:hypothetical protein